jgi:hypothetical protein
MAWMEQMVKTAAIAAGFSVLDRGVETWGVRLLDLD